MDDEPTFEELSAYADGELSGERAERVSRHLEDCETCQTVLDSISATRHRLAKVGAQREPTDALRWKLENRADQFRNGSSGGERTGESDGQNHARRAPWLVGGGIVAAAMLAAFGWFWGGESASGDRAVEEDWAEMFVTDHLHSRPTAKPMDVAGDDPERLVDFFAGRVSFEPVVPRLPDAELVGGRDCKLAGRHVQLLFYRHEGRVVSLFVTDDLGAPSTCRRSKGRSICIDQRRRLRLLLVGRAPPKDLRRLVENAAI